MRKIKIAELEKIFNLAINKLEDENISEIEIDNDLYRFIPTEKWDTFEDDVIESGSLFDDIDCLKLCLSDKNRVFTYVDIDRLSFLLRMISQIQNPID
jgi:hypothetical protein